jgi:tyrosinase
VLNADGAVDPIHVRLASPPGRGGRVVFAPRRDAEAGDEIELDLASDGTPADFWVLGRFQTPSRNDRDARIAVFTPGRVTPLVSFWLMVRVRKDAQTLTYYEKRRLLSALARIDDAAVGLYQSYRDAHTADTSDEAHDLDAFLPWHRAYLLDLERELQAVDPSVTIPYWRFDQPAPQLFAESFLGRSEPTGVVRFAASNPLQLFSSDGQIGITRLPRFDVATQMAGNINGPVIEEAVVINAAIPYTRLRPPVESNPHGQAHVSFSGYISRIPTAVRDPLFFFLHANVDRLWAKWQWINHRFDATRQDSYFFRTPANSPGSTRIGHNAPDTMWPWNNIRGGLRPNTAPRTPFPASPVVAAPGGSPTVGAMVDYQGVIDQANRLGFDYDDVPFELD